VGIDAYAEHEEVRRSQPIRHLSLRPRALVLRLWKAPWESVQTGWRTSTVDRRAKGTPLAGWSAS